VMARFFTLNGVTGCALREVTDRRSYVGFGKIARPDRSVASNIAATLAVTCLAIATTAMSQAPAVRADDSGMAKALANPLASLISVPLQFNTNHGFGTEDGDQLKLNVQPVIPIHITEDWNLITRTIIPIIWQNDISGDSGTQFGLGDTTSSLWFSPAKPTDFGLTWGVGPQLYIPTSTDSLLGVGEPGLGPTGIVLVQKGPWTVGGLANQVWSLGGDDIDSLFVQPFLSYNTPTHWTYTLNSESTYDWNTEEWSVPVNFKVAKLLKIGEQRIQLFAGARYYLESTDDGADGWGARFGVTFLFPGK